MTDLFALSEKILSEGVSNPPPVQISFELHKLDENIVMVDAFSHSIVFKTEEGLVVFDTGSEQGGKLIVDALRQWSRDLFHTIVYTHGHADHVGGSDAFLHDMDGASGKRPTVIAHQNILRRFQRYRLTNGYNLAINRRQFGNLADGKMSIASGAWFLPETVVWPDITYTDYMTFRVGSLDVELHHAKGETDDHSWAWIPKYKAICAGDLFIWSFPNAGNPQKVQRYPVEWAAAFREMAGQGAEYLLPAHGLPIKGKETIKEVLLVSAKVLENIIDQTLEMMNAGMKLDDILHSITLPEEVQDKPYLRPRYDEPEFIVRNLWRQFGGWYDGNPAHLKPPKESILAIEIANLAGGTNILASRADELSTTGAHRLACQLIETAVQANPEDPQLHEIRAVIYDRRRKVEQSLMAKGIFRTTALESKEFAEKQQKNRDS